MFEDSVRVVEEFKRFFYERRDEWHTHVCQFCFFQPESDPIHGIHSFRKADLSYDPEAACQMYMALYGHMSVYIVNNNAPFDGGYPPPNEDIIDVHTRLFGETIKDLTGEHVENSWAELESKYRSEFKIENSFARPFFQHYGLDVDFVVQRKIKTIMDRNAAAFYRMELTSSGRNSSYPFGSLNEEIPVFNKKLVLELCISMMKEAFSDFEVSRSLSSPSRHRMVKKISPGILLSISAEWKDVVSLETLLNAPFLWLDLISEELTKDIPPKSYTFFPHSNPIFAIVFPCEFYRSKRNIGGVFWGKEVTRDLFVFHLHQQFRVFKELITFTEPMLVSFINSLKQG